MHPAAILQFERMIGEFARWRARSRGRTVARAGVVVGTGDGAARHRSQLLPAEWRARLGLPEGATYADGRGNLPRRLPARRLLPWPYDFPRKQ